MDDFKFSFEMPPRRDDAPPPSSKKTRRIEAPDGVHWFDVRGGGTQVEGAYLSFLFDQIRRATEGREAGTVDEAAFQAAEVAVNAGLATYLADRVVAHNLTDYDDEPLPLGLGLFWAMPGADAMRLAWRIQARESVWNSPKAETSSTNG